MMNRDTYLKNEGATQFVVNHNNKQRRGEVKWNIDYDGKDADIDLDVTKNNKSKHYSYHLTNKDLVDMLKTPTKKTTLETQLIQDFPLEDFASPILGDELKPTIVNDDLVLPPLTSSNSEVKYIVVDIPKRTSQGTLKVTKSKKGSKRSSSKKSSNKRSSSKKSSNKRSSKRSSSKRSSKKSKKLSSYFKLS